MKINEAITKYLEWKSTYAPRATENYPIWLRRFSQTIGNKKVKDITVEDWVLFSKTLEHYSPVTIRYATIICKNFLLFLRLTDIKSLDPRVIRIPRVMSKPRTAVTEDDFRKIKALGYASYRSLQDQLIVSFLWDTGVRVSELCDININQVDTEKLTAIIQTKKSTKERRIFWGERTNQLLQEYLVTRVRLNKSLALFASQKGDRMVSRTVQRKIRDIVTRAGLDPTITTHSFRHGWGHYRRDKNAPLAFIQKGLGHSSPISTFIYEQYSDPDFEETAKSYF